MPTANNEAFFKILIVGDGAVGKTSICTSLTTNEFFADYNLTVGCDFFIKRMFINNVEVTLQIFDVGGQEHFAKMREAFAGGAKGIFLAFDITRRDSFYSLEDWYNSVKHELDPKAPKVLVATKTDLKELREVWKEDIQQFKLIIDYDAYIETSAMTGEGIEEAFKMMGLLLLSKYKEDEYKRSAQKMKFIEGFYKGFKK